MLYSGHGADTILQQIFGVGSLRHFFFFLPLGLRIYLNGEKQIYFEVTVTTLRFAEMSIYLFNP